MSTNVFPSLAGLGWPTSRSPIFKTRRQVNISGKEVRIADWSYPRYKWTLVFNFLRQGAGTFSSSYTEFSQLEGFFEKLLGGWDSFLYADPDDGVVVGQNIAVGNGVTTAFQLQRTFGGASCPILAPNLATTFNVYLNGVQQPGGNYTVTPWGATNPGLLTFVSPPGNGVLITADFTYYFPCRFDDDTLTFEKVLSFVYDCKKLSFTSIK